MKVYSLLLRPGEGLYIHREDKMNQYETGFVIAPNLSEEEISALIVQMAEVISAKRTDDQTGPLGEAQAGLSDQEFS